DGRGDGEIELLAVVYHAGGGNGGPVAEVGGAAVIGKGVETDAQLGAAPPDVSTFGGETDGRGEGERTAGGEGAAPFEVHGVWFGDERIDVQTLSKGDGGRAVLRRVAHEIRRGRGDRRQDAGQDAV